MESPWGRQGELEELEGLAAAAATGAGAVAVVEGPAGIGKSRLLAAAAERGTRRGMTVLAGRADELDQISPWLTLLRALESTDPPLLAANELRAAPDRLDQRGATLEAFRSCLESAAARGPLLVLLDDLQWADPETVGALSRLPEQLFSYPIVWLLARRPHPSSPNLEALVARLEQGGATRLHLHPLDGTAAMALAGEVAGRPVAMTADELLVTTGGNPLFVVEVAKGYGPRVGGGHQETPHDHGQDRDRRPDRLNAASESSLQAAVGAHLRSLSADTIHLLQLASVLGREFTAAEAGELSGWSSAQLLRAVRETLIAGVLVEEADQLAFCHDVFRQILYQSLPNSMRRALHRDAALALQRNGASLTRLAHQLAIGAEAGDTDTIALLHQTIGELVGTSPWAAADLAVRLVDLAAPGTDAHASAVAMAVRLLGWAGSSDAACQLGEEFLQATSAAPAIEAEILTGLRQAWMSSQIRPYPVPVPDRIYKDPNIPALARAALLAMDQFASLYAGDLEQADARLEKALAVIDGNGGGLDGAIAQVLWVTSAQFKGEFTLAFYRARQDLQLAAPDGAAATTFAESTTAQCLGGLGRIEEGLRTVERATEAAEECGYLFLKTDCECLRAAFFLDLGRIDDARAEASAASRAADNAGFTGYLLLALTTLVEASVRSGDLRGADAALLVLPRSDGHGVINPDEYWARAVVALAHRRGGLAMRTLQPVFAALAEDNFAIACRHPGRLPQLVRLAFDHGEHDTARSVAAAARRLAQANDGVALLEQVALHATGTATGDVALLRRARELSQASEVRLLHAILSEDLGEAEAAGGQRATAAAAFEEAFTCFLTMGAHHDATRVRAKLRKLGVRKRLAAISRPSHGWASLTPAELSVVEVVGRGATNRTAAKELCVSPDTVNTHLRHAFAKLGIRSRTELAHLLAVHNG